MRTDETNQADPAIGMATVVPWHVTYVRLLADLILELKFADGTEGLVDMAGFLTCDCGVFAPLREGCSTLRSGQRRFDPIPADFLRFPQTQAKLRLIYLTSL